MYRREKTKRAVYRTTAANVAFPLLILCYICVEPPSAPGFLLGPLAMIHLLVVARWDFLSYALRGVFLVLLMALTYDRAGWWGLDLTTVALVVYVVAVRRHDGPALDLEFPLRRSVYYIAHGGSTRLLNAHHFSESQRFALDVVAINWFGGRASGIYPQLLTAYRIFGDPVYSPCAGLVTEAVDGRPDMSIGQVDREHLAGNHLIIRKGKDDLYVGLAHLQQDSLCVRVGDLVEAGQRLARAGNSGNTSEPHFHIHAKRGGDPRSMLDGVGVPLRFNGRWLIRNSLVFGRLRRR